MCVCVCCVCVCVCTYICTCENHGKYRIYVKFPEEIAFSQLLPFRFLRSSHNRINYRKIRTIDNVALKLRTIHFILFNVINTRDFPSLYSHKDDFFFISIASFSFIARLAITQNFKKKGEKSIID